MVLKHFLLCLILCVSASVFAQNLTQDQIKKRMSEIRKTTNWNDSVAAKKANEEIKELSKQLMLLGKNQNLTNQSDSVKHELEKENIDYKLKLFGQIQESVKLGKGGDILLGRPIRQEIIEEYKEDEKIRFGTILTDELETLVIDMSVKEIKVLIDNMELLKSIKILIITGGDNNIPADLSLILKKAAKYPLSALYIINFKNHISSVPSEITIFQNLDTLGFFNNNLKSLSTPVEKLKKLKVLYVDNNPINTLYPTVSKLKNLEKLGLVNTSISEAEILKIKMLLPNCAVFTK